MAKRMIVNLQLVVIRNLLFKKQKFLTKIHLMILMIEKR